MFISDISIKRPVFTSMVILSLIVFGAIAFFELPLELFPKVELPVITITTPLKGSDPENIERKVTEPIEGAVSTISGIKRLTSTSQEGASIVAVEFQLERNVDIAYQEVQQKVASVRSQLPEDIDTPIIQKLAFDAAPIMQLVLSGNLKPAELYEVADKDIRERLQKLKNVGTVNIVGGQKRKIWLWLDPAKLKQHNLTAVDVKNALASQHIELAGGRLSGAGSEMPTRINAEFKSAVELEKLVVSPPGRDVIHLRDVGIAEDGVEEARSYSQRDSEPCITIDIYKQSNTNTVEVAERIRAEKEKIVKELAGRPGNLSIEIPVDLSIYVKQSVDEVYHHLLVGGVLAVITVFFFLLNVRSTFISALVLPTSIMATFMMLYAVGFTINFMTLMALQLAIGLLIDDAIVVQENIMRHVEAGKPARFAAAFATKEIGLAVLATTLSVVAVFMPTAFTKGMVGQFFFPFGMTISFAVLISMFVSFTLDPMLSSRMLKKVKHHNAVFVALEKFFKKLEDVYSHMLGWSLRWRWITALIAFVIFVASMAVGSKVKQEFQPEEDRSEFQVTMRSPLDADLATTKSHMIALQDEIKKVPEVEYVIFSIGGTTSGGAEGKVNAGSMYVKLTPKADRLKKKMRSQRQVMDLLRDKLATVKGPAVVGVQIFDAIGNSTGQKSAVIQYELVGSDLDKLDQYSQAILAKMKASGDYKDLDTSYEKGRKQSGVEIDKERARIYGVSPADIAGVQQLAIGGANIGTFRAGKDRYDIAVRYYDSARSSPSQLLELDIPTSHGNPIEVRSVAEVIESELPVEIHRFNRQRQITIMANLAPDRDLGKLKGEIAKFTEELNMPSGYSTEWTGQAEMMAESTQNLNVTMALSVLVVFMLLAAQFESIIHPITIMISLPLAFVGAMIGLFVFNQSQNIFTMMAFIFLLGLVTKNAILLIDYANTLREREGLKRDDAIRKAGPVRLRPILMTTFAMIFGMIPTAFGTGEGAETRQPMAVAIIGGLVSSTFLTLLVVPSVYSLLDPISEFIKRNFINRGLEAETPQPAEPINGHAQTAMPVKPVEPVPQTPPN